MKIVIFGGGGFIGSTIADRLLKDGHELKVFERPRVQPYRKFDSHERVQWVEGDFSSMHDVAEALKGMDVVLHLVSTTLPKSSNDDPLYDLQSNVLSTLQMLKAMVEHHVKRIVFISSGGTVYGLPRYVPIDERHPTEPLVSYGITKLTIEKYLNLYEYLNGITAISLRVSNPYGERQRVETAQGAVGVFLKNAIQGVPVSIWGDGSVTRDYIHVSDVAEAFVKAVTYKGKQRVFNVSSGCGVSLNELINMLERVLDKRIDRQYFESRPFDVPVSILDNTLACSELVWHPSVSMQDGLERTLNWMLSEFAPNRKSC